MFILDQGFLRCFRDPVRVPRIENRVTSISENYHRVPRIRENRVPTGPYRVRNIFFKKNCIRHFSFLSYLHKPQFGNTAS